MFTKQRLINVAIMVSFSFCFMDWGHDGSEFLIITEYEIIKHAFLDISVLLNPLLIVALSGQLLIVIDTIMHKADQKMTTVGIVLLSIIVILMMGFGIVTQKANIIASLVPFIAITSIFYIVKIKEKKRIME